MTRTAVEETSDEPEGDWFAVAGRVVDDLGSEPLVEIMVRLGVRSDAEGELERGLVVPRGATLSGTVRDSWGLTFPGPSLRFGSASLSGGLGASRTGWCRFSGPGSSG